MGKFPRIEDYNKTLPILECYTAVQAEGSRTGYPTIVVRTTGCSHRCAFSDGGWCDSWMTSIHPEKGLHSIQDVINLYDKNLHIKEMMITGGSPTMHPAIINELLYFAEDRKIFVTIETEGSHALENTDLLVDLVSISPKFSNSVPKLGMSTPLGKVVDQKFIDQHNKFRMKAPVIAKLINRHKSFQLKPVFDKNLSIKEEFEDFLNDLAEELVKLGYGSSDWTYPHDKEDTLEILKKRTYIMPAGDSRETLFESYPVVMNFCRDTGYKFTGRPHIIAFEKERYV